MQNVFQKLLEKQLIKNNISEEAAARFTNLVTIAHPGNERTEYQLIRNSRAGPDIFTARSNDEFFDEVLGRVKVLGEENTKAIRQALPDALARTDAIFTNPSFKNATERKIMAQWGHVESKLLPDFAEKIIGRSKLPYEDFVGKLSQENKSFLTRRTAQASGLRMFDDAGRPISDAVVKSHLKGIGIDPANAGHQRAFLIDHKAMSKPWSIDGRNICGFKPLSLEDAMGRGLFHSGSDNEAAIKRLSSAISKNDPVGGPAGSLKMSGVYESASGRIIDTTRFKRAAQKTVDILATEFHVPLVKLNPLTLFGQSARAEARDRSLFQYVPSKTNQAFLYGAQSTDDFYIWMRTNIRRGKVFAMGATKEEIGRASCRERV